MLHKQVPFVKQVPPLAHWHEFVFVRLLADITDIDTVVLGVTVEPDTHDDGGKQTHWPAPDTICCKHGHDATVQSVVKHWSKLFNLSK